MCGLILASPLHVCVSVCLRERGAECVLVRVWEMLRCWAGLYRLATPVHRGQSASNRKCVYKWGSYFYCFCHFTRSNISLITSSTSLSFFSGTSSYFSSLRCLLPAFVRWSLKVQKLAFKSSSPSHPGFQGSRSPSGILLSWFPHHRTLCPRDSAWHPLSVPQKF